MVSETIRWQTPLAHMRRTAPSDVEIGGKTIRQGRQGGHVVRLGQPRREVIDEPDAYIIDRERPRQHLSFGFGIHRCVGNRLAELQLKIIWEEILKRFPIDRGRRRAEAAEVVLPARLPQDDGPHPGEGLTRQGPASCTPITERR